MRRIHVPVANGARAEILHEATRARLEPGNERAQLWFGNSFQQPGHGERQFAGSPHSAV